MPPSSLDVWPLGQGMAHNTGSVKQWLRNKCKKTTNKWMDGEISKGWRRSILEKGGLGRGGLRWEDKHEQRHRETKEEPVAEMKVV